MTDKVQVVGYGRISETEQGEEDESLENQNELVTEYCDENEYKLEEWFQDANVSGATDPFQRDSFSEMVEYLQEHEDIKIILIKKGDRIRRGSSTRHVERELNLKLEQDVDVIKVAPTGVEEQIEQMKESENPTEQQMGEMMEDVMSGGEGMKVAKAKEEGKRVIAEKRAKGQPFHEPPRGVKIDKNGEGEKIWAPVTDHEDPKEEIGTVVQILNEVHTTDKSPYKAGKSMGIPSPDRNVKNMIGRKEMYANLVWKFDLDYPVKFMDTDLDI